MIRAVERSGGTNLVYEKAPILKKGAPHGLGEKEKTGLIRGKRKSQHNRAMVCGFAPFSRSVIV